MRRDSHLRLRRGPATTGRPVVHTPAAPARTPSSPGHRQCVRLRGGQAARLEHAGRDLTGIPRRSELAAVRCGRRSTKLRLASPLAAFHLSITLLGFGPRYAVGRWRSKAAVARGHRQVTAGEDARRPRAEHQRRPRSAGLGDAGTAGARRLRAGRHRRRRHRPRPVRRGPRAQPDERRGDRLDVRALRRARPAADGLRRSLRGADARRRRCAGRSTRLVGLPSVDDEPSSVREDSLASGDGGDVCRDPDPRAYGRTTTRPRPPSSSTAHCQRRTPTPARCRPLAPSTRAEGCLATDGVLDEAAWRGVRTQPRA
jgi:hypothetical protein